MELCLRRSGHLQVIHRVTVVFMQRAGAQQVKIMPGITSGVGIHPQLGLTKAVNPCT